MKYVFVCLERYIFHFYTEGYFYWMNNFSLAQLVFLVFFFLYFKGVIALLSDFYFPSQKINVSLTDAPLKEMYYFSSGILKISSCRNCTIMNLIVDSFAFILLGTWSPSKTISAIASSNIASARLPLCSLLWLQIHVFVPTLGVPYSSHAISAFFTHLISVLQF